MQLVQKDMGLMGVERIQRWNMVESDKKYGVVLQLVKERNYYDITDL